MSTPYCAEEFLDTNFLEFQLNSDVPLLKQEMRKEQDLRPCFRLK